MEQEKSKKEVEFSPFDLITGLLYYPLMGIGVRLGIAMYGVLFSNATGFSAFLGVIATLVITVIFGMLAVLPAYLIPKGLQYIWNYLKK